MNRLSIKVPSFQKSMFSKVDQSSLDASVIVTFSQAIDAIWHQNPINFYKEAAFEVTERATSTAGKNKWMIFSLLRPYFQNQNHNQRLICSSIENTNINPPSLFQTLLNLGRIPRETSTTKSLEYLEPLFKRQQDKEISTFAQMAIASVSICLRIVYERQLSNKPSECEYMNYLAASVCTEFLLLIEYIDREHSFDIY